uniref:Uncharacterized protein n=1 Tax=Chromera velia CCMP2878 TaxID=1169474 RepID=A0A0G4G4U6_9ALVE|eukprot:Cvel_20268.t1-p1 / transcript=Cvel_20268.t1 / gene=Cvel_20268 / organism=Chromera_velia_CCMP2878 / gene_product=hypothetical protein / transcript_product=hypothetical protein / location=Cvel_scaffold1808:23833-32138(+) / protein_length=2325 / sequence_SO=supercontig / SO=protein_coding / is_pseudo=false
MPTGAPVPSDAEAETALRSLLAAQKIPQEEAEFGIRLAVAFADIVTKNWSESSSFTTDHILSEALAQARQAHSDSRQSEQGGPMPGYNHGHAVHPSEMTRNPVGFPYHHQSFLSNRPNANIQTDRRSRAQTAMHSTRNLTSSLAADASSNRIPPGPVSPLAAAACARRMKNPHPKDQSSLSAAPHPLQAAQTRLRHSSTRAEMLARDFGTIRSPGAVFGGRGDGSGVFPISGASCASPPVSRAKRQTQQQSPVPNLSGTPRGSGAGVQMQWSNSLGASTPASASASGATPGSRRPQHPMNPRQGVFPSVSPTGSAKGRVQAQMQGTMEDYGSQMSPSEVPPQFRQRGGAAAAAAAFQGGRGGGGGQTPRSANLGPAPSPSSTSTNPAAHAQTTTTQKETAPKGTGGRRHHRVSTFRKKYELSFYSYVDKSLARTRRHPGWPHLSSSPRVCPENVQPYPYPSLDPQDPSLSIFPIVSHTQTTFSEDAERGRKTEEAKEGNSITTEPTRPSDIPSTIGGNTGACAAIPPSVSQTSIGGMSPSDNTSTSNRSKGPPQQQPSGVFHKLSEASSSAARLRTISSGAGTMPPPASAFTCPFDDETDLQRAKAYSLSTERSLRLLFDEHGEDMTHRTRHRLTQKEIRISGDLNDWTMVNEEAIILKGAEGLADLEAEAAPEGNLRPILTPADAGITEDLHPCPSPISVPLSYGLTRHPPSFGFFPSKKNPAEGGLVSVSGAPDGQAASASASVPVSREVSQKVEEKEVRVAGTTAEDAKEKKTEKEGPIEERHGAAPSGPATASGGVCPMSIDTDAAAEKEKKKFPTSVVGESPTIAPLSSPRPSFLPEAFCPFIVKNDPADFRAFVSERESLEVQRAWKDPRDRGENRAIRALSRGVMDRSVLSGKTITAHLTEEEDEAPFEWADLEETEPELPNNLPHFFAEFRRQHPHTANDARLGRLYHDHNSRRQAKHYAPPLIGPPAVGPPFYGKSNLDYIRSPEESQLLKMILKGLSDSETFEVLGMESVIYRSIEDWWVNLSGGFFPPPRKAQVADALERRRVALAEERIALRKEKERPQAAVSGGQGEGGEIDEGLNSVATTPPRFLKNAMGFPVYVKPEGVRRRKKRVTGKETKGVEQGLEEESSSDDEEDEMPRPPAWSLSLCSLCDTYHLPPLSRPEKPKASTKTKKMKKEEQPTVPPAASDGNSFGQPPLPKGDRPPCFSSSKEEKGGIQTGSPAGPSEGPPKVPLPKPIGDASDPGDIPPACTVAAGASSSSSSQSAPPVAAVSLVDGQSRCMSDDDEEDEEDEEDDPFFLFRRCDFYRSRRNIYRFDNELCSSESKKMRLQREVRKVLWRWQAGVSLKYKVPSNVKNEQKEGGENGSAAAASSEQAARGSQAPPMRHKVCRWTTSFVPGTKEAELAVDSVMGPAALALMGRKQGCVNHVQILCARESLDGDEAAAASGGGGTGKGKGEVMKKGRRPKLTAEARGGWAISDETDKEDEAERQWEAPNGFPDPIAKPYSLVGGQLKETADETESRVQRNRARHYNRHKTPAFLLGYYNCFLPLTEREAILRRHCLKRESETGKAKANLNAVVVPESATAQDDSTKQKEGGASESPFSSTLTATQIEEGNALLQNFGIHSGTVLCAVLRCRRADGVRPSKRELRLRRAFNMRRSPTDSDEEFEALIGPPPVETTVDPVSAAGERTKSRVSLTYPFAEEDAVANAQRLQRIRLLSMQALQLEREHEEKAAAERRREVERERDAERVKEEARRSVGMPFSDTPMQAADADPGGASAKNGGAEQTARRHDTRRASLGATPKSAHAGPSASPKGAGSRAYPSRRAAPPPLKMMDEEMYPDVPNRHFPEGHTAFPPTPAGTSRLPQPPPRKRPKGAGATAPSPVSAAEASRAVRHLSASPKAGGPHGTSVPHPASIPPMRSPRGSRRPPPYTHSPFDGDLKPPMPPVHIASLTGETLSPRVVHPQNFHPVPMGRIRAPHPLSPAHAQGPHPHSFGYAGAPHPLSPGHAHFPPPHPDPTARGPSYHTFHFHPPHPTHAHAPVHPHRFPHGMPPRPPSRSGAHRPIRIGRFGADGPGWTPVWTGDAPGAPGGGGQGDTSARRSAGGPTPPTFSGDASQPGRASRFSPANPQAPSSSLSPSSERLHRNGPGGSTAGAPFAPDLSPTRERPGLNPSGQGGLAGAAAKAQGGHIDRALGWPTPPFPQGLQTTPPAPSPQKQGATRDGDGMSSKPGRAPIPSLPSSETQTETVETETAQTQSKGQKRAREEPQTSQAQAEAGPLPLAASIPSAHDASLSQSAGAGQPSGTAGGSVGQQTHQ